MDSGTPAPSEEMNGRLAIGERGHYRSEITSAPSTLSVLELPRAPYIKDATPAQCHSKLHSGHTHVYAVRLPDGKTVYQEGLVPMTDLSPCNFPAGFTMKETYCAVNPAIFDKVGATNLLHRLSIHVDKDVVLGLVGTDRALLGCACEVNFDYGGSHKDGGVMIKVLMPAQTPADTLREVAQIRLRCQGGSVRYATAVITEPDYLWWNLHHNDDHMFRP